MIFTDLVEEMANEIARLWSVRETQHTGVHNTGVSPWGFPRYIYRSMGTHVKPSFLVFFPIIWVFKTFIFPWVVGVHGYMDG